MMLVVTTLSENTPVGNRLQAERVLVPSSGTSDGGSVLIIIRNKRSVREG
jgi:hypothetical protein